MSIALAQEGTQTVFSQPIFSDSNIATVRKLLERPEEKIDLVRAKLTIDKMIDSHIDIEATVAKVDAMAAQSKLVLPPNATTWDKMQTLRQFFYVAGPWNDNRPWHYNFDHPRGDDLSDMLLPNYIKTRKGQCVSMPLLFLSVALRLNMNVALALAPNHTFVMLKNDDGVWLNLETTADGAPTRLATYQRQRPMSQKALDYGAYMRPLNKREAVASMTSELIQSYLEKGKLEHAAALAELSLLYNPTDISIWLYESTAFNRIVRRDFITRYQTPKDIPADQRSRFNELTERSGKAQQRAFELGFLPPSEDADSSYMNVVNKAKSSFNDNGK